MTPPNLRSILVPSGDADSGEPEDPEHGTPAHVNRRLLFRTGLARRFPLRTAGHPDSYLPSAFEATDYRPLLPLGRYIWSQGAESGRGGSRFGRGRTSPAGREHRAGDDEREAQSEAEGERFAEQDDAEDEGDGRIDVGDDGRADGPDLVDEGEEDEEAEQRRDQREGDQRRRRTSPERCAGRLESPKGA